MGKVSRLRILLSAMVLLGLVLTPVLPGPVWAEAPPAGGNLYIVTSAADGGAGSLRAAIALAEASPGLDVITFALPAGSVILLSSELTVSGDLLLSGDQDGDPATADITLSGQGITRVLHVFAPASVTLLNLGISEGLAQGYNGFSGAVGSAGSTALAGGAGGNGTRGGTGQGGGIASSGDLYLLSCELTDNVARGGQGGQGGGGGGGGGGTYDFPGGAGGTGGDGGPGGKAIGGAVYSTGRLFTRDLRLSGNQALPGNGGWGGGGGGGGSSGGAHNLQPVSFAGTAGSGPAGGAGGDRPPNPSLTGYTPFTAGGQGGQGGEGAAFAWPSVAGSAGGPGGSDWGGYYSGPGGLGGAGGTLGEAEGPDIGLGLDGTWDAAYTGGPALAYLPLLPAWETAAAPRVVCTADTIDDLELTGTAGAGETVSLYAGSALVGEVTAAADGNWSWPLPAPAAEGAFRYTTLVRDSAGAIISLAPVKTLLWDHTPPAAPTDLTITAATATTASLDWTAGSDNLGLAGYHICRDGEPIGTTVYPGWQDTTLVPGTAYRYTVTAMDEAGWESAPSGGVTLSASREIAAEAPPYGALTNQSEWSVVMAGTGGDGSLPNLTDGQTETSARLAPYANNVGYHVQLEFDLGRVQTVSQVRADVAYGGPAGSTTLYTLRFSADNINWSGQLNYALPAGEGIVTLDFAPRALRWVKLNIQNYQTQADWHQYREMTLLNLAPPADLHQAAAGPASIDLGWTAPAALGIAGYEVWRDGVLLAVTPDTSYADSGLAWLTTYAYTVYALDAAGNRGQPATLAATTTDGLPPTAPAGLQVTGRTTTTVSLVWTAATDNVGVTAYTVWRDGAAAGMVTGTGFTDAGLAPASAYVYTVTARDAAGNVSDPGGPAPAETAAVPAPESLSVLENDGTAVTLAWTARDTAASYRVSRDGTLLAAVSGALGYRDTGLVPGTRYTYVVAAIDAAGAVSAPVTVTVTAGGGIPIVAASTAISPDGTNRHLALGPATPAAITITMPAGVTGTLSAADRLTDDGSRAAVVLPALTVTTQTGEGAFSLAVPAGTTLSAAAGWDGLIYLPAADPTPVAIPAEPGEAAVLHQVITLGAAAPLAADRGLRLCFPGAAGQAAGWEQNGVFHLITTVLSADSQAAGDALPPGGDGYCAAGGDLIVWTKHLTRFVTYATVAVPAARAGGPYSGRAGAGLILDGSGSATPAGALVSYEWDLNGDGVYDVWSDPANPAASLAVPWSVLSAVCALPINGSGGSYTGTVTLRISDSAGRTATDTAALVILPAEPAVRLQWRLPAGAAEVNPGDTFTLELTAEGVPELAGLAWELTYDPGTLAILTPAAPVAPGEPAAAWLPAENSAGAGTPAVLRFTAVSGGPGQDLVLPTVLASVTFHALQPGSLDFSFTGPAAAVKLSLSGPGGVPIGYTPTGTTLVIVSRGALLAADADGSGAVDFADLVRVALAYGSARSQPGYPAACDLNADGVVDIYDLVRVARAMV